MKTKLNDVLTYEQPTKYIVGDENYSDDFSIPVLTAGKSFILGYTNEKEGICEAGKSPVIIFDDFTADSKYVDFDFKVKSSAMKILRPRTQSDSLKYFYYAMQSIEYTSFSHKRVWISDYSNLTIPYPSPEKQQKIVSKLESVDSMIANAERQLALGDELVKSRFVEMFESNWKMIPLEQCCISISGGSTPSMAQSSYYGGDVPFIKSGDVKDSKISSGSLWLTQEALHKGRAKLVPSGTVIVVTRSGILKHFLPVAIALNPLVVNQDIKALQPKERFKSDYLAWAIRMNESLLLSKSRMTTVDNIESGDLYQLPIKDVSLALQNRFSEFVEQVDKSKLVIKKTLSELEELKDSLMQKYFFD